MIKNNASCAKTKWQKLLQQAIVDLPQLLSIVKLSPTDIALSAPLDTTFPLKVPIRFAKKMKKGDVTDPLLLQVLPIAAENYPSPGYSHDPLAEKQYNPLPGLLHKYRGRVLITPTIQCGIHCRYCFRRHFDYQNNLPGSQGLGAIYEYIAQDTTIEEVILSGGDPLMASDKYLAMISREIAQIAHVKTLRIHSRLPIILPERITDTFMNWFCHSRLQAVLVTHCNHPQELDNDHYQAFMQLKQHGVTLLNQSVLLKGINDDPQVLATLSKKLFSYGVLPYYLHRLDKVNGSAHFELSLATIQQLYQQLLTILPGYLVPKLVEEIPHKQHKQPIFI